MYKLSFRGIRPWNFEMYKTYHYVLRLRVIMVAWRDKLVEQIEPRNLYSKTEPPLCVLAPSHFREHLPPIISGKELLQRLLRYVPVRGRRPAAVTRDHRLQVRCSLQERMFLEEVAESYSVNVSTLIRACCLGKRGLSPVHPLHLEVGIKLDFIEAKLRGQVPHEGNALLLRGTTLLDQIRADLLVAQEILPPQIRKPRDQPRLTIRFTSREYARIKDQPFVALMWESILSRQWQRLPRVDAGIVGILRGVHDALKRCDGNLVVLESAIQEIQGVRDSILEANPYLGLAGANEARQDLK